MVTQGSVSWLGSFSSAQEGEPDSFTQGRNTCTVVLFFNTCILVILEVCETPNLRSYFKTFQANKNIFFSFSIRRERAL